MNAPPPRRPVRAVRSTWLAAAAVVAAVAATPARASGPDTGVRDASGGGGGTQTEQTLAVNPRDPRDVLIGYINGVSVSHDGGRTWRNNPEVSCSGDGNPAFDAAGTAYFECGGNGVQVQVYRSTDGGDQWSGPLTAATDADNGGDFIDRPWLVRGLAAHTLVVGWESFFTNPVGWVYLKVSTDGGLTWGPARKVDDPLTGFAAWDPRQHPVVGADGTIYVTYASGHAPWIVSQTLPLAYVVARSTDGGVSFTHSVAAADITRSSSPYEETEAISSLAADPSPRRAGHLALVWSDASGGVSRVLLVTSTDGGATWSAPVPVAPQPGGSTDQQDHPQAAFAPDGRVVVVWRDRACCGGGWTFPYELLARAVTLRGSGKVRPGRVVRVTAAPQQPNSATMYDEYLGLVVGPEGVSVAWNQPLGVTPTSFYRRMPLRELGS